MLDPARVGEGSHTRVVVNVVRFDQPMARKKPAGA